MPLNYLHFFLNIKIKKFCGTRRKTIWGPLHNLYFIKYICFNIIKQHIIYFETNEITKTTTKINTELIIKSPVYGEHNNNFKILA